MLFPRIKKPPIFTYRRVHHRQVFSGLPQECEGMQSHALTYLASVIDHVSLIQIHSSTAATVSCLSEKNSLHILAVSGNSSTVTKHIVVSGLN